MFICANYPEKGGVETVTGLLADFFLSKGNSVFLMVLEDPKKPISKQHRHYLQMVDMPGPLNSLLNISFLENFIQTNQIDCVFNQGVNSQIYNSASKYPKTIFINTLHSRPFWEVHLFISSKWSDMLVLQKGIVQKAKMLMRCLLGWVHPDLTHPSIRRFYRNQIERADWFVVLDKAFKKELESKLYQGDEQPKIRVIPNPLNNRTVRQTSKKKQVLFIGRLNAEPKRVDRLLRIWKSIEAQVPDWTLQILGDGEQRGNLEKITHDLQLKNVFFRGFQNPEPFYQSASILCLTSTFEGAPMVITEAQSYGTVPIAFGSVESIYNMIDNGTNGVIVPPFDEGTYAKELLKLIQEENQLRLLSENALSKVKDLNVENIGQQWLKLMDKH